jgi:hypothetical protein
VPPCKPLTTSISGRSRHSASTNLRDGRRAARRGCRCHLRLHPVPRCVLDAGDTPPDAEAFEVSLLGNGALAAAVIGSMAELLTDEAPGARPTLSSTVSRRETVETLSSKVSQHRATDPAQLSKTRFVGAPAFHSLPALAGLKRLRNPPEASLQNHLGRNMGRRSSHTGALRLLVCSTEQGFTVGRRRCRIADRWGWTGVAPALFLAPPLQRERLSEGRQGGGEQRRLGGEGCREGDRRARR